MVLDWEMHSPSVSVIVPVRDGRRQLKSCLETLTRQGVAANCEIIVVDDGSQDGSAEVAIQQQGVRVIRQGRIGAAAARNRGVRESCGEGRGVYQTRIVRRRSIGWSGLPGLSFEMAFPAL